MATLNMTDQMTALELVRRAQAPEPFKIIELMSLTNEMLIDIPAYECNNGTKHITVQRAIGPMGEHRIYNQGVGNAATQTSKVEDGTAILGAYSKVDEIMLQHSGNRNAARQSEAVGIVKGMGLTQANMCINASKLKTTEFDGLAIRLNKVDNKNVFSMGGTGSANTSIYLCAVGPDLFHFIYPKGSKTVGVSRQDLGVQHVPDESDPKKTLPMAIEYFEAQYGLSVRHQEAVKRICNIPAGIAPEELVDKIIEVRRKLPQGASTYVMYSNADILVKLDKAARDKANVVHTQADPWGKAITHVRDLRCRQMDAILSNEAAVA